MQDSTDPELLAALRAGDREAYAVLVARHQALVHRACSRQAPSPDVDDCTQAVFLILARRPAAAQRAPALQAWLLRTSWYVCRCAQRAARRRQSAERAAAGSTAHHPAPRPEALDHLDDCLARLPERQRAAVSLHYLAGKESDEIATILGISRDNAYQLVCRGLAGLRSMLGRRGIAIATPALLALLADEAHAADAAASPSAIASALATTPNASAGALASGAATAMTVATAAPVAAAIAALLGAAAITGVIAAESPPAPIAPPAAPVTIYDPASLLSTEVTFDFQQVPMAEVVRTIQSRTGLVMHLDPMLARTPFTLKVNRMPLKEFLHWVEMINGAKHELRDGTYHILGKDTAVTVPAPANTPPSDPTAALGDAFRLDDPLPEALVDLPISTAIEKLRLAANVSIIIHPASTTR